MQTCVTTHNIETQYRETTHYTETMFSIFSKSSKTIVDSDRGGVYTGDPSTPHPRPPGPPSEVRSCVAGHHKEYKRERKKSRTRHFRSMFSSDCEEEVTSVVSDNPQLYHRSCSMVSSSALGFLSSLPELHARKTNIKVYFDGLHPFILSLVSTVLMGNKTLVDNMIRWMEQIILGYPIFSLTW